MKKPTFLEQLEASRRAYFNAAAAARIISADTAKGKRLRAKARALEAVWDATYRAYADATQC